MPLSSSLVVTGCCHEINKSLSVLEPTSDPNPEATISRARLVGAGTASLSLGGCIISGISGIIYPLSIFVNFSILYSCAVIAKDIFLISSFIEFTIYCFKLPATLSPSSSCPDTV